jgi:hypothetical protein
MAFPEFSMQLISKFSFSLFVIFGLLTFFSFLRFNWVFGSVKTAIRASHSVELLISYPLRAVARPDDDRAMRLLHDFAKSKSDMGLQEDLILVLQNASKWRKLTVLFAIQFILTFIIGGVTHT